MDGLFETSHNQLFFLSWRNYAPHLNIWSFWVVILSKVVVVTSVSNLGHHAGYYRLPTTHDARWAELTPPVSCRVSREDPVPVSWHLPLLRTVYALLLLLRIQEAQEGGPRGDLADGRARLQQRASPLLREWPLQHSRQHVATLEWVWMGSGILYILTVCVLINQSVQYFS